MKQILNYLIALVLFFTVFTSCSPKYNFVTKGLPDQDSSYIITTANKRINANEIVVKQQGQLIVDKQEYPLTDVLAIKSKKMYFSVDNGSLYLGEIYGKINLLYTIKYSYVYKSNFATPASDPTFGGIPGSYSYKNTIKKSYFLQKKDSLKTIDALNHRNFIDYVSDNPVPLQKAKASYLWQYGSYVSAAGFATGIILTFKALFSSKDGETTSLGTPFLFLGTSFPLLIITQSVANHKIKKAITVYNQ